MDKIDIDKIYNDKITEEQNKSSNQKEFKKDNQIKKKILIQEVSNDEPNKDLNIDQISLNNTKNDNKVININFNNQSNINKNDAYNKDLEHIKSS